VNSDQPRPGGAAARPALSGRVADSAGRPVSGAVVMFVGASPAHQDIGQLTGADGRFRYAVLPPGRYFLLARDEQGRTGRADVDVPPDGGAHVEIIMTEETP